MAFIKDEKALSENLLLHILDSLMDYVIAVDKDLKILVMNKIFEKKGVIDDVNNQIGKYFYEVFPNFAEEKDFQEAIGKAKDKRATQFIPELKHVPRVESKIKHYKANISPISSDGEIEGFVFVFESLTDLVRESRINSLIASGVTHYIKNVANNINAEVLAFERKHDESYLSDIKIEVNRIAKVVDNFFYMKYRASRPAYKEIELLDVVSKVLINKRRTDSKDIAATIDIPEGFSVNADEDQIERVLDILVQNAYDEMKKGDRLTIKASKTEETISIEIINTGSNIHPEILSKLNEGIPFTSTKAKAGKGVGMGFFMAKYIIEEIYGGEIVPSNLDNNTVSILVEIPAQRKV